MHFGFSYLEQIAIYASCADDAHDPQNERLLRRKTAKKCCYATLHGLGDSTLQHLKYIHVFLKPALSERAQQGNSNTVKTISSKHV